MISLVSLFLLVVSARALKFLTITANSEMHCYEDCQAVFDRIEALSPDFIVVGEQEGCGAFIQKNEPTLGTCLSKLFAREGKYTQGGREKITGVTKLNKGFTVQVMDIFAKKGLALGDFKCTAIKYKAGSEKGSLHMTFSVMGQKFSIISTHLATNNEKAEAEINKWKGLVTEAAEAGEDFFFIVMGDLNYRWMPESQKNPGNEMPWENIAEEWLPILTDPTEIQETLGEYDSILNSPIMTDLGMSCGKGRSKTTVPYPPTYKRYKDTAEQRAACARYNEAFQKQVTGVSDVDFQEAAALCLFGKEKDKILKKSIAMKHGGLSIGILDRVCHKQQGDSGFGAKDSFTVEYEVVSHMNYGDHAVVLAIFDDGQSVLLRQNAFRNPKGFGRIHEFGRSRPDSASSATLAARALDKVLHSE